MIRLRVHTPVIHALFFLVLAASAQAEPITVDWGILERISNNPVEATRDARFRVYPYAGADDPQTEWRFTVEPSNIGQTFTVTEATAASQGFNWQLAENALLNPGDWRFATAFTNSDVPPGGGSQLPMLGEPPLPGGSRYLFTDVQQITFTLHEYFSNPLGSVLRWQYKASGEGLIVPVPEPDTFSLVLAVLTVVSLQHYSGTKRRHAPTTSHL
ncbi:MAG: hypothetical protein WD669_04190 [Pirellulales bacterium]